MNVSYVDYRAANSSCSSKFGINYVWTDPLLIPKIHPYVPC